MFAKVAQTICNFLSPQHPGLYHCCCYIFLCYYSCSYVYRYLFPREPKTAEVPKNIYRTFFFFFFLFICCCCSGNFYLVAVTGWRYKTAQRQFHLIYTILLIKRPLLLPVSLNIPFLSSRHTYFHWSTVDPE